MIEAFKVAVRGEVEGWFSLTECDLKARLPLEPLTRGEGGLDCLAPQGPIQCLNPGCVVGGWAQISRAVRGGVWIHNNFLRAEERYNNSLWPHKSAGYRRCIPLFTHPLISSFSKNPLRPTLCQVPWSCQGLRIEAGAL